MTYPARRTFLADMGRFTAALPLIDWSRDMAQQRVPRIGFMSGAEPSLISSFEDEMRKLGYSPGKSIHFEMRIGRLNTNDTATHAAELGAMSLAQIAQCDCDNQKGFDTFPKCDHECVEHDVSKACDRAAQSV